MDELKAILTDEDKNYYSGLYIEVSKKYRNSGDYYEISLGAQYNAPEITFKMLKSLSELFGTDKIDLDDYCNSAGCDTCGYGSDYGHTIQIYEPTINIDKLESLVGQRKEY